MSHLDYKKFGRKYWNSLGWKLTNQYLISKHGECQRCGEQDINKLVIHHLSYQDFPFDKEENLLVLCKDCHLDIHKKDEKLVYTKHQYENLDKDANFDLYKISRDVKDKKSKCCDICDDDPTSGGVYKIKDLIFYRKGKIKPAHSCFGRNFEKNELILCEDCRKMLRMNAPFIIDLDKNPIVAKALIRNTPNSNKKGEKNENKSQETL